MNEVLHPISSGPEPSAPRRPRALAIAMLLFAIGAILGAGALLYRHAVAGTNEVALAEAPKGVTMVAAVDQPFQPRRRYIGTTEPWIGAKVGPQIVSAYVDTVLVRPGDVVKRGQVIATLDCRNASAVEQAVAMQARAVEAQQKASAGEAARLASLDRKFVSQNDIDQKEADADSKAAQALALKAQMAGSSLEVADCVLRAPFDGEIAQRAMDPGAYVRPGSSIATVVDRHIVRITADVPEDDFANVVPGNEVRVHLLAKDRAPADRDHTDRDPASGDFTAKIMRRAPSADPDTRTVHIEIDVDDPAKTIPVGTTAELSLDVGTPIPATAIPLISAAVHGSKTTVFVVKDGVAHAIRAKLLGERKGTFYVDPSLAPGSLVVTEGRGLLDDNDRVAGKAEPWTPNAESEK